MTKSNLEITTLAGGCFWCTEAVFKRVLGVESVIPGFSGGELENPTSDKVYMGNTNHAEAIQINFNPSIISYESLLDIFFATHDPTTLNRQGADMGTQYRSAIFHHSQKQKQIALNKIKELETAKKFSDPIVTQIVPFTAFYKAEDYHLNYYDKNPLAPYCRIVIDPKIRKLMVNYSDKVKADYK